MRNRTYALAGVGLLNLFGLLSLVGCSPNQGAVSPNTSGGTAPANTSTGGSVVVNNATAASNGTISNNNAPGNTISSRDPFASTTVGAWPDADWVLTDALMKQKQWITLYNQNLSINQRIYGPQYDYEYWQIPPKWTPYLYKNEKWTNTHPLELNHPTLFITLQGTVFLKQGTAARDWPPISATDIPPDATIVAEFVPVKKAVEAGIIPVHHSQPQVDSVSNTVLEVLGMNEAEYQKFIGQPKQ